MSPTANRFWVGGSGSWNLTTHWSTTSGGASGASVPTNADVAFLDANSGTATVTIVGGSVCRALNCTGFTGTLTSTGTFTVGDATGGAFTLSAGMTYTVANAITFAATSDNSGAGWLITSAGKTFGGSLTFSGVGGKWKLADAFTSSAGVTHTAGTLDTQGFNVTVPNYISSGATTRGLILGASTVTLNGNVATPWNTTGTLGLTAGTSTIILTGQTVATTFNGASLAYNNVTLTGFTSSLVLSGVNSFSGNLTVTPGAAPTTLAIPNAQTISGVCTLTGYDAGANRLLLASSTLGTVRQWVVNGSWGAGTANLDVMDVTTGGTASFNLSAIPGGLGDAGGNGLWTFTASATQTWQGTAGGNWSDVTKWTSRVPLPQDDVVIASAFAAAQTITVDVPRMGRSINWTGSTGAPTWNLPSAAAMYGSLTLVAGMTSSGSLNLLTLSGRGTHTIRSNSAAFPGGWNQNGPGGTYTLQDALTTTGSNGALTHTAGTFDTAGFNVTLGSVASTGTIARTLTTRASTISLGGSSGWSLTGSGLTADFSATTVVFASVLTASRTFAGNGFSYGTLTYTVAGSTGALVVTGANTFGALNVGSGRTLTLPSSTTTTVTTWNVAGVSGSLTTVNSSTAGTAATISSTTTQIISDYLTMQDSTATGGAEWYAGAHSVSTSNNTGWKFVSPVNASRQAVWAVATKVGQQRQGLWAVRAAVGTTRQAVWAVRTAVGGQRQALWSTRLTVGSTRQALWAVRTTVGQQKQALWSTRSTVSSARQALWAVRASVGDQRQVLWSVRATTGAQRQMLWHGRMILGAQRQVLWDVHVPAGAQLEAIWNVAALYIVTAAGGDWADPATWMSGLVPDQTTPVILAAFSGDLTVAGGDCYSFDADDPRFGPYGGTFEIANFVTLGLVAGFRLSAPMTFTADPSSARLYFYGDVALPDAPWPITSAGHDLPNLAFEGLGWWEQTDDLTASWTSWNSPLTYTSNGHAITVIGCDFGHDDAEIVDLAGSTLTILGVDFLNDSNEDTSVNRVVIAPDEVVIPNALVGGPVIFNLLGTHWPKITHQVDGSTGLHFVGIAGGGSIGQLVVSGDGNAVKNGGDYPYDTDPITPLPITEAFDVNGSPTGRVSVVGPFDFTGSGVVSVNWLDISNSAVTPATTWFAGNNALNSGGNSGWTFGGGVPVGAEIEMFWSTPAVVGEQRQQLWTVAATAVGSCNLDWSTRTRASNNRDLRWPVRRQTGKQQTLLWQVTAAVAGSRNLRWTLAAVLNASRGLDWNTRATASRTRDVRWATRTHTGAATSLDWQLTQAITAARLLEWATQRTVGDSRIFEWDALTLAAVAVELFWRVRPGPNRNITIIGSYPGARFSGSFSALRFTASYPADN